MHPKHQTGERTAGVRYVKFMVCKLWFKKSLNSFKWHSRCCSGRAHTPWAAVDQPNSWFSFMGQAPWDLVSILSLYFRLSFSEWQIFIESLLLRKAETSNSYLMSTALHLAVCLYPALQGSVASWYPWRDCLGPASACVEGSHWPL